MPELVEQMYCSQQIVIPPKFPYILKKYCKAAIKTQPYDLLRWSFEYFHALAENRSPPVKLRLEYPIYSTEGGLTKGCLKVLANQLAGSSVVPLKAVEDAWRGFCLDSAELDRILCLCEVYLREMDVTFLHFIAVAGGLLTKTLTHTMILLCETLTKEPDGGSAAIPIKDFLTMYTYLATIDASKDVKYYDGFREGVTPPQEDEEVIEEETARSAEIETELVAAEASADDFWKDGPTQKLGLTNDRVSLSTRLSLKLAMPTHGALERSPSMERANQIERENFLRERTGKPTASIEMDTLKEISAGKMTSQQKIITPGPKEDETAKKGNQVEILIEDEDGNEIHEETAEEAEFVEEEVEGKEEGREEGLGETEEAPMVEKVTISEKERIQTYVENCYEQRNVRREDLEKTFNEIGEIVCKFKTANYDLGMVAGRQMSITSAEFVVQDIEKDIMDYINDQIAILPDPDKKKKKAKPEEVAMIKDLLAKFIDENLDVIVQEDEEVEEEEAPLPKVTVVYGVPGIGPVVDADYIQDFVEYATHASKVQNDLFMPRNIRHFMCPPLEKYEEPAYEKPEKELPTEGVIIN